jgi:hypothetical protein
MSATLRGENWITLTPHIRHACRGRQRCASARRRDYVLACAPSPTAVSDVHHDSGRWQPSIIPCGSGKCVDDDGSYAPRPGFPSHPRTPGRVHQSKPPRISGPHPRADATRGNDPRFPFPRDLPQVNLRGPPLTKSRATTHGFQRHSPRPQGISRRHLSDENAILICLSAGNRLEGIPRGSDQSISSRPGFPRAYHRISVTLRPPAHPALLLFLFRALPALRSWAPWQPSVAMALSVSDIVRHSLSAKGKGISESSPYPALAANH